MAANLVEPIAQELYAPVTNEDLVKFAVDQVTPWGTFTRIGPTVEFSEIPPMALQPSNWPCTYPDTTGWTEKVPDSPPEVPHYPSKLAREGQIRNLVSCYGIEDRGDGGGTFSLVSKSMMEYAKAMREK